MPPANDTYFAAYDLVSSDLVTVQHLVSLQKQVLEAAAMAKFFNSMASSITSAFNKNIDPNQVREVAATQYAVLPVRRREDCLLLYCPAPTADGKAGPAGEGAMVFSSQGGDSRRASVTLETGPPYEVVVQSERNVNYCYSLFRTRDISEAEARYNFLLHL